MKKKAYTKPCAIYENFELMDAVAACSAVVNHKNADECEWFDEAYMGLGAFSGLNVACEVTIEEYDIGTLIGSGTVFGS